MKNRKIDSQNKNSNIVINFHSSTDKEILDFLSNLNISGVRVSNLFRRWAIDVPFWKESYLVEKLAESELVEKVYTLPRGQKIYRDQTGARYED